MKEKKRKVWLTAEQVQKMLELAKARSFRDHLLLLLMRYGVRCGEIVGWRGLPGIRVQDIRDNGIWIKGKGYAAGIVQDRLVPMPPYVIELLNSFIGLGRRRPEDKVFPLSEYWAEHIVKGYAKSAGMEDWERVGPHRLRAFFATDAKEKGQDAFTIRDLMRHKNITTTNLYVGQSSPERLAKVVRNLASQETT
jgi:integrase